jgi:hypothetical protein
MDPGLVPGDLHGEPSRDVLGLQLQAPLHFDLAQEVVDSLMSIIVLLPSRVMLRVEPHHGLEQVIPLHPNPLGFCVVLVHLLSQCRSLLLSHGNKTMGVHFPDSKIVHLLGGRGELNDSLVISDELHR